MLSAEFLTRLLSRQLLAINPDNHRYHTALREVLGLLPSSSGDLSERQQSELEALYEGLVQDFPKNLTPPRMQLDFLVRGRACRRRREHETTAEGSS